MPGEGPPISLSLKESTYIGRKHQSYLVGRSEHLSRTHLEVRHDGDYSMKVVGMNPVSVVGANTGIKEQVETGSSRVLRPGDVIEFVPNDPQLRFELREALPTSSAELRNWLYAKLP